MRHARLIALALLTACAEGPAPDKGAAPADDTGGGPDDDTGGGPDDDTGGAPDDDTGGAPTLDADGDGIELGEDCDDADATLGAPTTRWVDADGDGHGSADISAPLCGPTPGFVESNDDCDDTNADAHPGAAERCDGADNDCDGLLDLEDPDVVDGAALTVYVDADRDGVGDAATASTTCVVGEGESLASGDCDDTDPSISVGPLFFGDIDRDGYGGTEYTTQACTAPDGYVATGDDCDDRAPEVHPGAPEVCNAGLDDDCDGLADDDDSDVDPSTARWFYTDADTDGYGASGSVPVAACAAPAGTSADDTDCDDTRPGVRPDIAEVCHDGVDNNCDGTAAGCEPSGAIPATELDATWSGEVIIEYAGEALGADGDLDGDGYGDLIIGAPYSDPISRSGTGRAYVLYGSASPSGGPLASAPAIITGAGRYSYLGHQVDIVGDVNQDGYDDMVVGAPGDSTLLAYSGAAYLFLGGPTRLSGGLSTSAADAAYRRGTSNARFATSVAGAGDVDGDGFDDLLIGGPADALRYGAVYLIYGSPAPDASTTVSTSTPNFSGGLSNGELGQRYSIGALDHDGDGLNDLALGEPLNSAHGASWGKVYLHYGDAARFTGTTIAASADATLNGPGFPGADTAFGYAVAEGTDINGDGYDELVASGHWYDQNGYNSGAVFIYLGGPSRRLGVIPNNAMDATLLGVNPFDLFGCDLAGGDDVNSDSYEDLVIGAWGWDTPAADAGAAYVSLGSATPSGTTDADDLAFWLEGAAASDANGFGVALGDFNGDGIGDVYTGASAGAGSYGSASVFSGVLGL
jgi:hypothetical protein